MLPIPGVVCPSCKSTLTDLNVQVIDDAATDDAVSQDALWACDECQVVYPVLGGIPILVPDPADWLATYWDSAISTLAEFGCIGKHTVTLADQVAQFGRGAEPRRFGDDWTPHEREGSWTPPWLLEEEFKNVANSEAPLVQFGVWLFKNVHMLRDSMLGTLDVTGKLPVLEVGPGAGLFSMALVERKIPLVVADISLRSVLVTLGGAMKYQTDHQPMVRGVVADAEALPFADESFEAVVALNVVDLLDQPLEFLQEANRVTAPLGQLLLTTPKPDLNMSAPVLGDPDETLVRLVTEAKYNDVGTLPGTPWIRAHEERRYEILWLMALRATKSPPRPKRTKKK